MVEAVLPFVIAPSLFLCNVCACQIIFYVSVSELRLAGEVSVHLLLLLLFCCFLVVYVVFAVVFLDCFVLFFFEFFCFVLFVGCCCCCCFLCCFLLFFFWGGEEAEGLFTCFNLNQERTARKKITF